jgi:hypothetical protein
MYLASCWINGTLLPLEKELLAEISDNGNLR